MFDLVDAEKAKYPVQVLCDVLEVSRSGFYAWKKRPPSARDASDEQLAVEIAATHAKSKNLAQHRAVAAGSLRPLAQRSLVVWISTPGRRRRGRTRRMASRNG